jgi:hypothetical protein
MELLSKNNDKLIIGKDKVNLNVVLGNLVMYKIIINLNMFSMNMKDRILRLISRTYIITSKYRHKSMSNLQI